MVPLRTAAGPLMLLAATACTQGPDFETEVQPIFNENCTCHLQGPSGTMQAPTMTLNADRSYDEIVNVPAEGAEGIDRIEPGKPNRSYMWHKLSGTHEDVQGEGTAMPPPPVEPLDDELLDTIREWVSAGAEP